MRSVVPQHWVERLQRHLRAKYGDDRNKLSAYDFPSGQAVRITFPDGSQVHFRHAFALADSASGEVAVFTEHCGYHIFPLVDAQVEVLGQPPPTATPN